MSYTIDAISEGRLMPINYNDIRIKNKADYCTTGGIPRIHFQWVVLEMVDLNDNDADIVNELYPECEIHVTSNFKQFVWAAKINDGEIEVNHKWVCNFRRYGWSESSSPDHGYCNDIIYGNGVDSGLVSIDEEGVIRDTLIAFMQKSRVPSVLKFDAGVSELWQRLLDDALENKTRAASVPLTRRSTPIGSTVINNK